MCKAAERHSRQKAQQGGHSGAYLTNEVARGMGARSDALRVRSEASTPCRTEGCAARNTRIESTFWLAEQVVDYGARDDNDVVIPPPPSREGDAMMNLGRRDRPFDTKDLDSSALKASTLGTVGTAHRASDGTLTRTAESSGSALRPHRGADSRANSGGDARPCGKPLAEFDFGVGRHRPIRGSKLCVGPKIKLKGVEISDCDVLVVEGEVEATVTARRCRSRNQNAQGTRVDRRRRNYGDFSGELTARANSSCTAPGVSPGPFATDKLIVAEGGELSGDVQRLDATMSRRRRGSRAPRPSLRRCFGRPERADNRGLTRAIRNPGRASGRGGRATCPALRCCSARQDGRMAAPCRSASR